MILDKMHSPSVYFMLFAGFFPILCFMLSQCHLNSKTKGLKLYKNDFKGLPYCLSFETLRFYVPL